MKYLWVALLTVLCSACGGNLFFTPNGHRLMYKSENGQMSCYTDNCCYPYKEKTMVCVETSYGFGLFNSISVEVKYTPDK